MQLLCDRVRARKDDGRLRTGFLFVRKIGQALTLGTQPVIAMDRGMNLMAKPQSNLVGAF